MSPGRPRSPERLASENTKLKADLATANEHFDREVAMRLRDEAERTLQKAEELGQRCRSLEGERDRALQALKVLHCLSLTLTNDILSEEIYLPSR